MASNTKQAKREAISKRKNYEDNYEGLLCSLFDNAVTVENLPADLPKRYLLRVLRNKGRIAYDKETGLYLPCVEVGIDVYGLPTQYTLVGYNGYVLTRKPEEVVILRANDLSYPIKHYINIQIEKLVDFDMAIEQNLEAIKTMTIVEVPSEDCLLSIANENQAKRVGASIVYRNKKGMEGIELKATNTGASYLVDKLLEGRKEVFNETLSGLGINVANVDKKERVQGEEIRASQGFAIDCLNTLIETFNHDAEIGGLSIRFKGNTSLYEQYELDVKQQEKEIENQGKENEDVKI